MMLVIIVGQEACGACVGFRGLISLLAGTDAISLSLSLSGHRIRHNCLSRQCPPEGQNAATHRG